MILEHDNLIIFGHPRSATKLIASTLNDFGYHSYGEWYDLWSSKINDHTAVRLSPPDIKKVRVQNLSDINFLKFKHTSELIELHERWEKTHQTLNPPSWVITLWPYDLENFPFLIDKFKNHHWICPTRDRWTQLLSWMISLYNCNYNGDIESKSITVFEEHFNNSYWRLRSTEVTQSWILSNFSSTQVRFDEITSGTFTGFGKDYMIKTMDEHSNLESLILNVNDVREWFNKLEKITL